MIRRWFIRIRIGIMLMIIHYAARTIIVINPVQFIGSCRCTCTCWISTCNITGRMMVRRRTWSLGVVISFMEGYDVMRQGTIRIFSFYGRYGLRCTCSSSTCSFIGWCIMSRITMGTRTIRVRVVVVSSIRPMIMRCCVRIIRVWSRGDTMASRAVRGISVRCRWYDGSIRIITSWWTRR